MILKYTITSNMISSVVSISEKIGRLKEIRETNKHIDFDKACVTKNIQRILKEKGIIYPDKVISDLLNLGYSTHPLLKEGETIHTAIKLHTSYLTNKELDFNTYIQIYNESQLFEVLYIESLYRIIKRPDFSPHFFLYYIADFCNECNNVTSDYFIEGWLINRFHKEYGMILSLPYGNYLEEQKRINGFSYEIYRAHSHTAPPRYEFFLSVIDILLDQCIEDYYQLSNPKSDRVELLKGIIKEPFSRKNYMAYYDISKPTASLDIGKAVEKGTLIMEGDKRNAVYWYKESKQKNIYDRDIKTSGSFSRRML